MSVCKHCNVETFLTGVYHYNKHVKWCPDNPNIGKSSNQYIKAKELGIKVEISSDTRRKISEGNKRRIISESTKKLISSSRKEWLKNNPELHPWKRDEKFKSKPCEHLKSILLNLGFEFAEEFEPLSTRHFSVDIAFVNKKLAIEVNGEQHYNRDQTLKPYYQERHDLIKAEGWDIIELHYAKCYAPHIDDTIKLIIYRLNNTHVCMT